MQICGKKRQILIGNSETVREEEYFCERIRKKALYRKQQLRHCQRNRPVVLDDVNPDVSVPRDVRVQNFG